MVRPDTEMPPKARDGNTLSAHLELLADMGREFASSLTIDDALKRAVERITRHLDAAGGALFMLEDGGRTLRCQACTGATEITGLTLEAGEGIVGRVVQDNHGEIVRDVRTDPNFYDRVDRQTGFTTRSILCAPLSIKDERLGAIELINKRGEDGRFDDADLNLLESLATSAALAILNARMAAQLVEQERIRRELELAAEIQRSLLPAPGDDRFPVHGLNRPARTISGDFFDHFRLADGRIGFNVGDVSGKGMNAALLMAKTASLYRCLGKTVLEPGRLLALIDVELSETTTHGMFVTMVGGVLDPRTGVVRLANAGHEPPLHQRRDGSFVALPAEAPPLGIGFGPPMGEAFPETELRLDGGTLYVFTDGVTEGWDETGRRLGVEGLMAAIRTLAAVPLRERLERIVVGVCHDEAQLHDDVTILAVEEGPRRGATD